MCGDRVQSAASSSPRTAATLLGWACKPDKWRLHDTMTMRDTTAAWAGSSSPCISAAYLRHQQWCVQVSITFMLRQPVDGTLRYTAYTAPRVSVMAGHTLVMPPLEQVLTQNPTIESSAGACRGLWPITATVKIPEIFCICSTCMQHQATVTASGCYIGCQQQLCSIICPAVPPPPTSRVLLPLKCRPRAARASAKPISVSCCSNSVLTSTGTCSSARQAAGACCAECPLPEGCACLVD